MRDVGETLEVAQAEGLAVVSDGPQVALAPVDGVVFIRRNSRNLRIGCLAMRFDAIDPTLPGAAAAVYLDRRVELRLGLGTVSGRQQRRTPTVQRVGLLERQAVFFGERERFFEVWRERTPLCGGQPTFRALDRTHSAEPILALREDLATYLEVNLGTVQPARFDLQSCRLRPDADLKPGVGRIVEPRRFVKNFERVTGVTR